MNHDGGTADVVVLTALNVEYQALRPHLADLRTCRHPAGTMFEVGALTGTALRVAVAVLGAGTATAAALTERAIGWFQPRALFFIGIAGALHPDLHTGDVIVATKVYAYQGRRDDNAGTHTRPESYPASHDLEQLARHTIHNPAWRAHLPPQPGNRQPAVHFKPIVAGDVVLNTRTGELARRLRRTFNDAVAIEMESAGAARASHLNHSLPTITIRGISDHADGSKDTTDTTGGPTTAAANAAAFTTAVLAGYATHCMPTDPPAPTRSPPATAAHEESWGQAR